MDPEIDDLSDEQFAEAFAQAFNPFSPESHIGDATYQFIAYERKGATYYWAYLPDRDRYDSEARDMLKDVGIDCERSENPAIKCDGKWKVMTFGGYLLQDAEGVFNGPRWDGLPNYTAGRGPGIPLSSDLGGVPGPSAVEATLDNKDHDLAYTLEHWAGSHGDFYDNFEQHQQNWDSIGGQYFHNYPHILYNRRDPLKDRVRCDDPKCTLQRDRQPPGRRKKVVREKGAAAYTLPMVTPRGWMVQVVRARRRTESHFGKVWTMLAVCIRGRFRCFPPSTTPGDRDGPPPSKTPGGRDPRKPTTPGGGGSPGTPTTPGGGGGGGARPPPPTPNGTPPTPGTTSGRQEDEPAPPPPDGAPASPTTDESGERTSTVPSGGSGKHGCSPRGCGCDGCRDEGLVVAWHGAMQRPLVDWATAYRATASVATDLRNHAPNGQLRPLLEHGLANGS